MRIDRYAQQRANRIPQVKLKASLIINLNIVIRLVLLEVENVLNIPIGPMTGEHADESIINQLYLYCVPPR